MRHSTRWALSLYTAPVRLLGPALAALAYVVSFVSLLVWPVAVALVLLVTWPFDRNRAIAGRLLRLVGVLISRSFPLWKIRLEGRWPPGRGAYVVVANHQSFLDIFLMCHLPREMKWIAKRELFRIPWVGWSFYLSGDIPLDRGHTASALAVMARARRYLDRGMSVVIFPEGTRSPDGKLLPFKAGAFKLALEAGVPVLPIAISGTAQGMPKGGPWLRPSQLTLRILDPVPTKGLGNRDLRRLRDDARERIARALGQESEVGPRRRRTP